MRPSTSTVIAVLSLVLAEATVANPLPSPSTASYNSATASSTPLSPYASWVLSALSSDTSVFPSGTGTSAHVSTFTSGVNGVESDLFTSTITSGDTTLVTTIATQVPVASASFSPAVTSFTNGAERSTLIPGMLLIGATLLSVPAACML